MKVIFLGTGEFSLTVLKTVYSSRHTVVAAVAQPDRVNARNGRIIPSPVSVFARENDIKLFKFERIGSGAEELKALGADVMLTASYGQMLPESVLNLCPFGVINTHASLLPKYRGASPIQAAIEAGETETGVSVMRTVMKMDAGDIIAAEKMRLTGEENSAECFEKLAVIAARLAVEALNALEDGTAVTVRQDERQATYCKKLKKSDGKIDFSLPAEKIHNIVRAYYGFPGTYFEYNGKTVKIIKSRVTEGADAAPGTVIESEPKRGLKIQCGDGAIEALTVQGEGGKAMSAGDYLRGHPIEKGSVIV